MRRAAFPLLLLAIGLSLSACAGAAQRTPAARNGAAAPAAEANNGEAPAIPYTDTRAGYRIDAPGAMAANADGSASFVGPQERLEVAIRTGAGLDPAALAAADLATLRTSLAGFRLVSGPAAIQLGGRPAQKLVYSWSAGTSAVTGKPVELMTARYYLAKDGTKVAVITYGITASQYDPQGADDVALTFGWK
ncbi:MAG TPA: hypothetical protein VIN34_01390 [Candidatus Limnocylindria bacterium]|jgi:hypothetical protein